MKHFAFLLFSLFLLTISCDQNEVFQICNDEDIWYVDADGDGFGTGNAVELEDCTDTLGFARNNTDCDDANPTLHEKLTYYKDADNDGYGNPTVDSLSCGQPAGYVLNNDDCDDEDSNSATAKNYYVDSDGDGYGAGDVISTCTPESNYVENNTDCDDNNADVWEGNTYYQDADEDGLGNPEVSQYACEQPDGYVANSDDEDDTVANETGILADFNEYFYGKVWKCLNTTNPQYVTIFGAQQNTIEGIEVFDNEPEVKAADFEVMVSPSNADELLIISEIFPQLFYEEQQSNDTIRVTSISENTMSIYLLGQNATTTTNQAFVRGTNSDSSCIDRDRLFSANWLIALDDYSKQYLTEDSIRFINTMSILNKPLNFYGKIGYPSMPDGNDDLSENFITLMDDCTTLYSVNQALYNNNFNPSPHLFVGFEENSIVQDTLFAKNGHCNNCEQLRFLIVD